MYDEMEPGDRGRREQDAFEAVNAVARPREQAGAPESGLLTGDYSRAGGDGDALFPGQPGGGGEGNDTSGTAAPAQDDGYGEFAWPDGYSADLKAMARFIPVARKLGLDKNGAQELASVYADLDLERRREQARFIERNNAEWQREIRGHPEFGGHNLARTGAGVAGMMRRYGSPLLMEQIRQMNVQNWPEMFYFLARVSQAVSEDCSPSSETEAARSMSTAQILFPGLK